MFAGTIATSVFIQASSLLQGVVVARLLGPIGRGEYASVVLWPSMFAAVGLFGSNIALARIAAKARDALPVYRSALILALCTSSFWMLACYFSIPLLMPSDAQHLVSLARIYTIFVFFNHLGLNLAAVDQGLGNFRHLNFTRGLLYPLNLLLLVIFWASDQVDVFWFALALLTANLVVVAFRIFLVFQNKKITGKVHPLGEIAEQSTRFGLAGIANPICNQIDKALLLWTLGAPSLGLYTVALAAASVPGSVTTATGMISFTMAAREEPGSGFERIAATFRLSLLLWLGLGSALAVVLPWLLSFVYGPGFASATSSARILIAGSAFGGLSAQLEQAMRGQGRAFVGLEGRVVGLAVLGSSSFLLLPQYGLDGISTAFSLGQLGGLLVILWRVHGHYGENSRIAAYLPKWSDKDSLRDFMRRRKASISSGG